MNIDRLFSSALPTGGASGFDDLESDDFRSDIMSAERAEGDLNRAVAAANLEVAYTEQCKKCKGSGKFYSYSGRAVGNCFSCKGKGTKSFKTSSEARAASRDYGAKRRAETARTIAQEAADWATAHQDVFEWIRLYQSKGNTFAASLMEKLMRYGALTDPQVQAVRKSIAKATERTNDTVARSIEVDVTKIQRAFDAARANYVPKPKMTLGTFLFSRAPDSGQNPGAIYVKEGADYLGKIVAGKLMPTFECTEERKQEIAKIAADPLQSAIAYGLRTRRCAICARSLTQEDSVDIGIGPICREKYGW